MTSIGDDDVVQWRPEEVSRCWRFDPLLMGGGDR